MRKQILLLEMYTLRVKLLEDRMAFFKKNYLPRMAQYVTGGGVPEAIQRRAKITPQDTPEDAGMKMIEFVSTFDPDGGKKFTQWLLNLLLKAGKDANGAVARVMQFEDLPGARDLLVGFTQHVRQLPPEARDINRFKSPGDLAQALQPLITQGVVASNRELERQEEREVYAETTVLFNDAQYRIVIPRTKRAAIFFGRNTRWCTAAKSNNMFGHYHGRGALYVILDKKNNRRWQFHWEDNQFMDELDRQIDKFDFCAQHPAIAAFFDNHMENGNLLLEVNGFNVFKNASSLIIERQDREGRGRGIHKSPPTATIQIQDGYLVSGDISYLFPEAQPSPYSGRHHDYNKPTEFPIHIEDGADQVADIMNRIQMPVRYDIQKVLADWAVFGDAEGYFGALSEVGTNILTVGRGLAWYELDCGNGRFFALRKGGDELTYACMAREGEEAGKFFASAPDDEEERKALVKLLFHLKQVVALPESKYYFNSAHFDQAEAAQVIDANGGMADLLTLYKAFGSKNDRFQTAFQARLREAGFNMKLRTIANGTRLIMDEYNDVEAFIDEWGDDYAKRVSSQLFGSEHYDADIEDDADESTRYDLLNALKKTNPALFKKLGKYMVASYADEIAEKQDEDEDYTFDPNDVQEIIDLVGESDDYGVGECFDFAYRDGCEVGARDDMYERFTKDLEGFKDLFFIRDNEPERPYQMDLPFDGTVKDHIQYLDKFAHDTPVVIAPEFKDVIAAFISPDWEDEIAQSGDWRRYLRDYTDSGDEAEFTHEEPHYGYSGYTAEAANDRFADMIRELTDHL